MIFRYEYPGGVWVDLEQPSGEEIRHIAHEFSISERIETELLSPTPSPLAAGDEGNALLVLHFPAHGNKSNDAKNQEIDFIVGKDFIITVRYEVVVPLYHLKKLLEAQKLVSSQHTISTDVLIEILFAHLYTSVRDHTNHVADSLARTEHEMFDGHERQTVRIISDISREFLHLEAALANQEEPLDHFLKALAHRGFFGVSFAQRAQRILDERTQVERLIKTHRAIATEMRETNMALLEARQNEIMKTLTIVNFIFLPLGLISWTFAMRTEGTPIINSPHAFWIVLGIMLGVATLLTAFFIKKRWL
ncbi:MAG: magnesium transporter CorA family protein [Patescibacteria group bacterium]|nr:magnesium transporter CorA family protein [Patescibacteria group bacterium]